MRMCVHLIKRCRDVTRQSSMFGTCTTQVLYDALRPALIAVQSLDELCELVDILKHEVRVHNVN